MTRYNFYKPHISDWGQKTKKSSGMNHLDLFPENFLFYMLLF